MIFRASSSLVRNSAFSTVTTNSRGVKSSLMKQHLVERRARRTNLAASLGTGVGHRQFSDGSMVRGQYCYCLPTAPRLQPFARPDLPPVAQGGDLRGSEARKGLAGGGNAGGAWFPQWPPRVRRRRAVRRMPRAAPATARARCLSRVGWWRDRRGLAARRCAARILRLPETMQRPVRSRAALLPRRFRETARQPVGWASGPAPPVGRTQAPRPDHSPPPPLGDDGRGLIRAGIAEVPEHQDRRPASAA